MKGTGHYALSILLLVLVFFVMESWGGAFGSSPAGGKGDKRPPASLPQTPSTTFFVSPHADDWILFDTPDAINDVRNTNNKTVFIYFTAGDAGCGAGCYSPVGHVPYYLVRHDAAERATRFVATLDGLVGPGVESTVEINQHKILRYVYGRTVSYFLFLPDGKPDGTGYAAAGYQSLKRLYNGDITRFEAIDGSTTYDSWTDLVNTVNALIVATAAGSSNVWSNVPDPSTVADPGEHSDHYYSGLAMQAAVVNLPCVNQALFENYATASLPENLTSTEALLQAATFGAYTSVRVDYGVISNYVSESKWLGREYYRTIMGNGSCTW